MGRTLLCWAALAVVVPTVAAAEPPRAVILPIRHDLAGNPEAVIADVRTQLVERIETLGYDLLPAAAGETCLPPATAGDPEGRLAAAARACDSELAIEAEIQSSPIDFTISLRAGDADARLLGAWENTCDFCAESEMVGRWSDLSLRLPPPDEGIERLAEVRHAAAAAAVVPEVGSVIGSDAAPDDEGPGIEDVPWWFWTGAGVSVAGLVAGAVLVAVDGDGTCGGPIHTCPEIYDTDAGGYALMAVAVAALAAAGIGLYFALSDDETSGEPAAAGSFAVFPSPVGLVVRGGFDL